MIHNFAIYDTVTKVLDFHFGAGFRDDLFNPGKYGWFGGHGAGSSRFLHD